MNAEEKAGIAKAIKLIQERIRKGYDNGTWYDGIRCALSTLQDYYVDRDKKALGKPSKDRR